MDYSSDDDESSSSIMDDDFGWGMAAKPKWPPPPPQQQHQQQAVQQQQLFRQQYVPQQQQIGQDDHNDSSNIIRQMELEQLIEARRRAEESNLIDLFSEPGCSVAHNDNGAADSSPPTTDQDQQEQEVGGSSGGETTAWPSSGTWDALPTSPVPSTYKKDKLPLRAIIYDYTIQPIGVIEHKREYRPREIRALTYPFLRPIYIDGVGLIKAYRGCCSGENNMLPHQCLPGELHFPLMPIVRCLFYWISRGHRTVVCFSQEFSPIVSPIFNASDGDKRQLKVLEKYKMAEFFDCSNSNCQWFVQKQESMRACLITTVPHYLQGMPSNLNHSLDDNICRQDRLMCPDRLLQPFYDHKGHTVFFSLFNNKNQCVDSIVLDDAINSAEEFGQIDQHQLSFVDQVLQLKVLFDLLPREARVREANVMVELFGRLKPFL